MQNFRDAQNRLAGGYQPEQEEPDRISDAQEIDEQRADTEEMGSVHQYDQIMKSTQYKYITIGEYRERILNPKYGAEAEKLKNRTDTVEYPKQETSWAEIEKQFFLLSITCTM